MATTQLLVVGAGPYALSTAACARRHGVEMIVLGRPMGFWREHMPAGMFLRSGTDWHLDAAGVSSSPRAIPVDDYLRTNVEHIFAAGDVNGRSKLVQSARLEGRVAAWNAVHGPARQLDEAEARYLRAHELVPADQWAYAKLVEARLMKLAPEKRDRELEVILKTTGRGNRHLLGLQARLRSQVGDQDAAARRISSRLGRCHGGGVAAIGTRSPRAVSGAVCPHGEGSRAAAEVGAHGGVRDDLRRVSRLGARLEVPPGKTRNSNRNPRHPPALQPPSSRSGYTSAARNRADLCE